MFYGNIVRNWINGKARTYSYYIKVKTERGRYKVWKKRIVNEQFIIKKRGRQNSGGETGTERKIILNTVEHSIEKKKIENKKEEAEHLWTLMVDMLFWLVD